MSKTKTILVIGPGAIGGVVAAVLARDSFDVTLVTKYPELAEKISTKGIRVLGEQGEFSQLIPSVAGASELEGHFDYVLIATKADALEQAAGDVLPLLGPDSRVVSMQNGICEEILAGVVGSGRTIGCVVGWGGTMHEAGKVEMTSGGECIMGNWDGERDDRLEELGTIMGHVIETRTTDHILAELYSKLIINSCITTLGAICGLYLGEMLASRKARKIFIEIIREAIAVADSMGLKVPPGAGGKLDYYSFMAPGLLNGIKRHLILRVIGMKYRRLKSSSLQSLERGRRTEVDNYNGYISAKGKEHSVPTPVNDLLTGMVREIEKGKRKISPENFREIPV